jgi:hypothetical protein
MRTVGEHRVAAGPLAVRWLGFELEPFRAGSLVEIRVALENAGTEAWRSAETQPEGVKLSYHWLDELGNPIVWDGLRTAFPAPVEPGAQVEAPLTARVPIPPGRYRFAIDLVDERRLWFGELGGSALELDVEVGPRIERRALAARIRPGPADLAAETRAALAAQSEPLVEKAEEAVAVAELGAGCLPAPDWSRRILDAHSEGFGVVGGSVEPVGGRLRRRRASTALAAWAPGSGRNPGFGRPLLCPSILRELTYAWLEDVEGLPALALPEDEPWLYDGRIAIRARLRSGRRHD